MGNNSIVWLAFDFQLKSICVLKIFRSSKSSTDVDDFYLSRKAGMEYIYKKHIVKEKKKNIKHKYRIFNVM